MQNFIEKKNSLSLEIAVFYFYLFNDEFTLLSVLIYFFLFKTYDTFEFIMGTCAIKKGASEGYCVCLPNNKSGSKQMFYETQPCISGKR